MARVETHSDEDLASASKKPVPVSSDHGQVHVYDDIEEHDNPLPLWWLTTFFGTIVFALGYFYYFQVFHSAQTPLDELDAEVAADHARKVAQGKASGDIAPETLVAMSHDQRAVDEGAATFASTCAACHGAAGEGKIGPNLTDSNWLHGGKPEAIYKTISEGVASKGMPAWGPTLGARKSQQVTAFVLSIKGKNVAGGKAPQGEEEH
jgi:cytochrome c oxidase cbb3-type subunit 3